MLKPVFFLKCMLIASIACAQHAEMDSILTRHFQKAGGKNSWKQIKSYYVEQTGFENPIYLPSHNSSIQHQLIEKSKKTYFRYPEYSRVEIYWDGDLKGTFLTNADEAKGFNYVAGHEEIFSEKMRKLMQVTNQFYPLGPTPLILSTIEDNKIEYEGLVEAYGKDCYKFLITTEGLSGKFIVFIDADTYFVHATSNIETPDRYKIYDQYQDVEGIIIPYRLSGYDKDELFEKFRILEVTINKKIEDYIFEIW